MLSEDPKLDNALSAAVTSGMIPVDMVRDALGTSAQNVLETMYFTVLEEEAGAGVPLTGGPNMRAQLEFSGEWNGSFFVETSFDAAREVAANFTGMLNAEAIGDQTAGEVLGEMANMVCGSILSFLGRQKRFDLSSPKITGPDLPADPAQPGLPVPSGVQVQRTFILAGGSAIRFAIASAAFLP